MLFMNNKGTAPSKKEMVDSWKELFGCEVARHSAIGAQEPWHTCLGA